MTQLRRHWWKLIPVGFFGIFFAFPLSQIIVASFTLDGRLPQGISGNVVVNPRGSR